VEAGRIRPAGRSLGTTGLEDISAFNVMLLLDRFCVGVGGASELTGGGEQRCWPRPPEGQECVPEPAERLRVAAGAGE